MDNQENLTQEELQSKIDYIFANSFNHTQHAYIDITGDLIAGTLLSQIMYWFSLDKNKKSKIRIFKDGNYWLAKGREDWYEEIRISPKQYDTAVKKLKEKGLVETKLYKFNAVPTTHIRPVFTEINSKINEWKKKIELEIAGGNDTDITMSENSVLPNGENGNSQSVNMEVDKMVNSLTENTNSDYINRDYNTENTDKYTLEDVKRPSSKGNIYTSVPEEHKDVPPKKQSRYIPPDYTEEQLIEHIRPTIEDNLKTVMEDCGVEYNPDMTDTLVEVIRDFYSQYYDKTGHRHRILPDASLVNVMYKFFDPPEELFDTPYDVDMYAALTEEYLSVEFDMEYTPSISHFMGKQMRAILYHRTK